MKSFKFTYTEESIAGSHSREVTVEARTVLSAYKKLYAIRGNREFSSIELKSTNSIYRGKP